jgi:hypothetical protein
MNVTTNFVIDQSSSVRGEIKEIDTGWPRSSNVGRRDKEGSTKADNCYTDNGFGEDIKMALNETCYERGWMFRISTVETSGLLSQTLSHIINEIHTKFILKTKRTMEFKFMFLIFFFAFWKFNVVQSLGLRRRDTTDTHRLPNLKRTERVRERERDMSWVSVSTCRWQCCSE